MRLDTPLDDIFASGTHVKVLRALYGLPAQMMASGREVARRAGVSHPRANKVLTELSEAGVVNVQRLPRTDLYRLNRDHAMADQLIQLFAREPKLKFELLSLIAQELKRRKLPVTEARIFGSVARGQMTADSDVDLALVTSRDGVEQVREAEQEIAESVRTRFGVRLNVLVGSPSLGSLGRAGRPGRDLWNNIKRESIDVLAGNA